MKRYAAMTAVGESLITLWSLREDVALETGAPDGSVLLLTRWGEIPVPQPDELVLEFLHRMSLGPVSLDNVVRSAADLQRLTKLIGVLHQVIIRSVGPADGGSPLLSVVPISQRSSFEPHPLPPDAKVRFSRMALMRGQNHVLVLESPLADHRVLLHRPAARALAAALAAPSGLPALAQIADLPLPWTVELVGYLVAAGMVVVADGSAPPRFAEDDDPVLAPWTPHELLFHANTQARYGDLPPDGGRPTPEPVLKERPRGPRFPLFRPRLEDLLTTDPPLTAALEARHASRRFSAAPVNAEQIGELLYRTARLRAVRTGPGDDPTVGDRPYPSTGGLHELEIYVITRGGGGTPAGIHHYDPGDHLLTLIAEAPQHVTVLLEGTRIAGALPERPALMLAITARFGRLAGMHQGDAYAAVLRHAGALLQSLYLVGTAMGLAACAVPARDDDGFINDVLGLDWRAESTVGGMVLGCPVDDLPESPGRVPVNDADWPQWAHHRIRRGA